MWAQGNIIRRGSQGRTNPFAPQEVTKRRCVLSSKFFDHLFYAADTQYYYVDVANKPLTYLKYSIESVEIGLQGRVETTPLAMRVAKNWLNNTRVKFKHVVQQLKQFIIGKLVI